MGIRTDDEGLEYVDIGGRYVALRKNTLDQPAFDQHRQSVGQSLAGQYSAIRENQWPHDSQTVAVTFRRCGGLSGSSPSRCERSFAMR